MVGNHHRCEVVISVATAHRVHARVHTCVDAAHLAVEGLRDVRGIAAYGNSVKVGVSQADARTQFGYRAQQEVPSNCRSQTEAGQRKQQLFTTGHVRASLSLACCWREPWSLRANITSAKFSLQQPHRT